MESDLPFILLVLRGKCTFATKAYNAARLGASAVILIDNKDEDPSNVIPYSDPTKTRKINIPTILVKEDEFKDITDAVKSHKSDISTNEHDILLSISFPIRKAKTANVSFLLDISFKKNLQTVANIKEYLLPLIKDGSVKVQNFYDVQVIESLDSVEKPYNCVGFNDSYICAKSSSKVPF
jgi:hypothetical protein